MASVSVESGRTNNEQPASTEEEKLLSQVHKSLNLKVYNSGEWINVVNTRKGYSYSPAICKVPDEIYNLNKGAYAPSVVSIGPLHNGEEHLQALEYYKLDYLSFITFRISAPSDEVDPILRKYEAAMVEITDLQFCFEFYFQLGRTDIQVIKDWNAERARFATMFFIDGIFVLEHLLRNYYRKMGIDVKVAGGKSIKARKIGGLIMDNCFMYSAVQRDLLLLENQIPFKAVKKLFAITVQEFPPGQPRPLSLTELVLSFFGGSDEFGDDLDLTGDKHLDNVWSKADDDTTRHFLHLLHSSYMPPPYHRRPPHYDEDDSTSRDMWISFSREDPGFKYAATQLELAGVDLVAGDTKDLFKVKFSTSTSTCSFLHWRPCKSATFEIPPLRITYTTEPFLRNLIAFEQTSRAQPRLFTSHLFLMGKLMNSEEDVELLINKGIIRNYLSSTEEVLHLFNNICKNVNVHEFYYVEEWKEASKYCRRFWPKCVAALRRDYFGTPWTIISVFAAIVLFVLTMLQTIYTMRPYV